MSTKKPRKRKNSNIKRLTLVSQYVLKNIGIVYTLEQKANFIDLRTKQLIAATPSMVSAANDVQHNWQVFVAVMLENQIGEQYIKIAECTPERRCYQVDMLERLNEAHIELIDSTKLADRVNTGWVAVPSGKELTEEQVTELLECLPCWGVYERGSIKTETDKRRERAAEIKALEALC